MTEPVTDPVTDPVEPRRPGRALVPLWIVLGLVFAALVALAAYKAWPLLYPEVVATAPLDPACDLRCAFCSIPGAKTQHNKSEVASEQAVHLGQCVCSSTRNDGLSLHASSEP